MYEQHFGISAAPFQLSPDPHFYFDSVQHRIAMTALRRMFSQPLTFMVLSGEVGAGKTTVLRAWLAEFEAAGGCAALVANTQLDPTDLMRAVAIGFGAVAPNEASSDPSVGLNRFLHGLAGRAALLVIDEAHNLQRDALLELTRFADSASAWDARVRICLAGQPELNLHLGDAALSVLQSRTQQTCHLAALGAHETRQYIEHRLRRVGWAGRPSIEASAFEAIHRCTGGIPRRINALANRLMLEQFLGDTERIDSSAVVATAQALHAELDASRPIEPPSGMRHVPPFHAASAGASPIPRGALVLLTCGRSDMVQAAPLLRAIGRHRDLPPVVLVCAGDTASWKLNRDLHAFLGIKQRPILLARDVQPERAILQALTAQLVEQCRPRAVIVFEGNPVAEECARAARGHGVPIVRVGGVSGRGFVSGDAQLSTGAIRRPVDLHLGFGPPSQCLMAARAVRTASIGSLSIDAVRVALEFTRRRPRGHASKPLGHVIAPNARGYGVIAMRNFAAFAQPVQLPAIAAVLRRVSVDLPLLWPLRPSEMLLMKRDGLARDLAADRITCIDELGHADFVCLIGNATCVLTDCGDVMDEAALLGVPCLSIGVGPGAFDHDSMAERGCAGAIDLTGSPNHASRRVWDILFNGGKRHAVPSFWDGHAAERAAAHLARWYAETISAPRDAGVG